MKDKYIKWYVLEVYISYAVDGIENLKNICDLKKKHIESSRSIL